MAWTEDADDPVAKGLKKYKGDLVKAARLAAAALEGAGGEAGDERDDREALAAGIRRVLEFSGNEADARGKLGEAALGAFAKTVNEAMTWCMRKGNQRAEFLRPGGKAIEPDWLPGVRIYVLGPPRDPKKIGNMGEHGDPELYELAARQAGDLATSLGFFAADEPFDAFYANCPPEERAELARVIPFDARYRIETRHPQVRRDFADYFSREHAWRRIDNDWLAGASDLALQIDNRINNTSLALAFEIIADGRVLLYPADAQLGNWLSWHDPGMVWKVKKPGGGTQEVRAADLLRRTILYKVGHHSSHNATLEEHGLEMMGHEELMAFIPVDRTVATHKEWDMPARPLYRRLIEKTSGRVVRSDTGWPARKDSDFGSLFPPADWARFESTQGKAEKKRKNKARVTIGELHVDWELETT
jgi:hypothetical protein